MQRFKAGDSVRVRSAREILATLDTNGSLDGLPFMPEMLQFCGCELAVFKRIHKTCDLQRGTGGLLPSGPFVTLENNRCDGSAHGGCQASCTLLWHQAWLEPASRRHASSAVAVSTAPELPASWSIRPRETHDAPLRYRCQVTEQPNYTQPLNAFRFGQYFEDLASGNITLREFFLGLYRTIYRWLIQWGVGYRFWVWGYNHMQRMFGGSPHPYVQGKLDKTPVANLGLQKGEWARIKPFDEIVATLNHNNRNRGLWFVPQEMGNYCGEQHQVATRVERILDERTGEMVEFKTPTVILDGVYCRGSAIPRSVFCPRNSALMWREVWLERAAPPESK